MPHMRLLLLYLWSDLMANTATKTANSAVSSSCFSRKIGNTTFIVSVSFSKKTKESIDDKILKLVINGIQQMEVSKCS